MQKLASIFLQLVTIFIGIVVWIFLLWEPHLEGRNVGATLTQIYLHDPFLIFVYIGSIPFFLGLYQVYKLLTYARTKQIHTQASLQALQTIKYCALATIAFVVWAAIWIMLTHGNDDATGAFALGIIIIIISLIVAATAMVLEGMMEKK